MVRLHCHNYANTLSTMHDVLRQRLIRKIEGLPDEQVYQILDYIEFMESKYAIKDDVEASGFQRFAEEVEDKLRRRAVSPGTIRRAFQLISSTDKVLADVSSAGRKILNDLSTALDSDSRPATEVVADILRVQVDGENPETLGARYREDGSHGEHTGELVEENEK